MRKPYEVEWALRQDMIAVAWLCSLQRNTDDSRVCCILMRDEIDCDQSMPWWSFLLSLLFTFGGALVFAIKAGALC